MKELPKRFTDAVTKLYTAFHNGKLNAFKCSACAVGNIIGHGNWSGIHHQFNNGKLCLYKQNIISSYDQYENVTNNSGYSLRELSEVEYVFLKEWEKENSTKGTDKEIQFKGLEAVVKYLCELDDIPNVMDYTSLFEFNENNEPVKELSI